MTVEDTVTRARALSDDEVLRVFRALYARVVSRISPRSIRDVATDVDALGPLLRLQEDLGDVPGEAVLDVGRRLIEASAADPALAPMVADAMDAPDRGEESVIGTVLALGAVVNLTILVATTRITVEKDAEGNVRWSIEKREASPALVEAIVKPIAEAATALLGGGA